MNSKLFLLPILFITLLSQYTSASVCVTPANAWYTYPNLTNGSFQNFLKFPNCGIGANLSGFAYIMVVIVFWIVMIMSMGDYDIMARIAVASLTFSIIASIMSILQLFDIYMPVFFGLVTVIETIALYFSTNARA